MCVGKERGGSLTRPSRHPSGRGRNSACTACHGTAGATEVPAAATASAVQQGNRHLGLQLRPSPGLRPLQDSPVALVTSLTARLCAGSQGSPHPPSTARQLARANNIVLRLPGGVGYRLWGCHLCEAITATLGSVTEPSWQDAWCACSRKNGVTIGALQQSRNELCGICAGTHASVIADASGSVVPETP